MIRHLYYRFDTWIQRMSARRFYTGLALIYAALIAFGVYAWIRYHETGARPQCLGEDPPMACDEGRR